MPNHVTNKVTAARPVLESMLNEQGLVDFNRILPFKGEFPWNGVSGAAETAAEATLKAPLHENTLIASLQQDNRERVDILGLDDGDFEQFVQMLRNKRLCGFLHDMDFNREAWGTKWNAYEQIVDLEEGYLLFDTAWSCPQPLLTALSKLHPTEEIHVVFADEDIGSNCGSFTLLNGALVSQDIAGCWVDMDKAEQEKWSTFARGVKGWADTEED